MIYLICSFILCSVIWLITTKARSSFYINIAMLITGLAIVFVQKNIQMGVILSILLIYFCFMYKGSSLTKQSNTYSEIIRYIPIAVVLIYCLILNNNTSTKNETNEVSITIASLISIFSILICFLGMKVANNKTKGDRDYD